MTGREMSVRMARETLGQAVKANGRNGKLPGAKLV